MTDDYRHPSLIIEELSDLQKLIKENEDLMSEYPDKLSLKFRNQSFRDRQDFLLSELMNSLERLQINAFDVVIEGDVVADHRIPLSFFGDLMSNYQDITSSIAQALTGKPTIKGTISSDILKASQLDLVATATGSFKVILSSHQPQIGESSVKTSLRYFNDLIECGDNKEAIKELASKLGIRVLKKYKQFLNIIYQNKANLIMYGKSTSENFHTQNITSELAKRIYDVIDEVEKVPEVSETYTGVLMGLSFVSYDFEFQEQKSKKIIHVAFSEDLENEVISRLRKSVTAKFKISTVFSDITYEEKKEWRLERFEE